MYLKGEQLCKLVHGGSGNVGIVRVHICRVVVGHCEVKEGGGGACCHGFGPKVTGVFPACNIKPYYSHFKLLMYIVCKSYSYKTLLRVHEMHGRTHPN